MDDVFYREWQGLHRRVAAGETLNATDQATYDAGCQELDAEEDLDGDIQRLRDLRANIAEAEAQQQRLREREHDLDTRIAVLETCLDIHTLVRGGQEMPTCGN